MIVSANNPYTALQKETLNLGYQRWSSKNRNIVTDKWAELNAADACAELLQDISPEAHILDFGCGAARDIVLRASRFPQMDGADISATALLRAKEYIGEAIPDQPYHNALHTVDGVSLRPIANQQYDVIYSAFTFQFITVYDIRRSILNDCKRVLRPDGKLVFQMACGGDDRNVDYYYNNYASQLINGIGGVNANQDEIYKDLAEFGYKDIDINIVEAAVRDAHDCFPNWVMVRCSV